MALFSLPEVRRRAQSATTFRSASDILLRESKEYTPGKTYDIFLSHCFKDAEAVLGIQLSLQDMGYAVYVDWLEDTHLNREQVTKSTAETLKKRMQVSKSLFFASSDQSPNSKWMPWELGLFDGLKGRVAILPVSLTTSYSDSYSGQEYLSLYPYVTKGPRYGTYGDALWIQAPNSTPVFFGDWLRGDNPNTRTRY